MARRALVLGSQIEGLRGVDNDAQRIAAVLAARGFTIDLRIGADATRNGMLAGYDQLIAESATGDAAVVYYCGHGYHASASAAARAWQCIAPWDLRESTHDDWRGITGFELSIKQSELTKKTHNVTVIMDCCHSARISRSDGVEGAIPRALPHPVHIGFDHHLAALRERYGSAFDGVDAISNPHAVRVVACGLYECAFESPDQATGEFHGAFTDALVEVLNQAGDTPVSWGTIIGTIRARVLRRFVRQRPDAEGPTRRGLFSLSELEEMRCVAVTPVADHLRLAVGRISGATVGDVYDVWSMAPVCSNERALGQAEVTEVFATVSNARRTAGVDRIPTGAVAVPDRLAKQRWPITVVGAGSLRVELEAAIAGSSTLQVAEVGDASVATVRLAGGGVTIEDAGGPLFPPVHHPDDLRGVLGNLANLGVAQGLRELEGEHGVPAGELDVELGIVRNGKIERNMEHGSVFALHDRYYVKVEIRGQRPLFVHVLNISARGKVKLLTDFERGGMLLDHREPSVVLGQRADGALLGIGLRWPEGLPKAGLPRLTELIVIAAPTATDLTGLETRELVVTRDGRNQLQQRLAQLCDGKYRSGAAGGALDGFYLKRLSFLLMPDLPSVVAGTASESDAS